MEKLPDFVIRGAMELANRTADYASPWGLEISTMNDQIKSFKQKRTKLKEEINQINCAIDDLETRLLNFEKDQKEAREFLEKHGIDWKQK